jgi:hypothetical protein
MSSKKYNMTVESVNRWAEHELQHVGYLLGVEDPDIHSERGEWHVAFARCSF